MTDIQLRVLERACSLPPGEEALVSETEWQAAMELQRLGLLCKLRGFSASGWWACTATRSGRAELAAHRGRTRTPAE